MPGPHLETREVGVGGGGGERSLKLFSLFGPKVRGGPGPQSPPLDPPLTEGIRKRSFICQKGK